MILECPQCNARFLVADALIPAGGRTVRCGACSHQWHVEKPFSAESAALEAVPIAAEPTIDSIDATLNDAPQLANVPAIARRRFASKPFKIAAPLLLLLWAALAIVTYFPRWQTLPGLNAFYSMIGAKPVDGLVFADVRMDRADAGESKTQFILSGSIVNHASQTRTVPSVRVMLNNAQGKTIWSRDYTVNQELNAGEVYPFRIANIETSFGSDVVTIVLDLGHSLQLVMRR